MKQSLDNAHTISDIIDIIQEHSSLTSCSHLKGVARRFNVIAVLEKIEAYYKFVNDFCQYKMANHIYMKPFLTAKSFDFTPSTTITFKLRWRPNDKTLSDILELLQQAFDEQSVYVHIVVVRGGSVRVICCAPLYLMTELVRLALLWIPHEKLSSVEQCVEVYSRHRVYSRDEGTTIVTLDQSYFLTTVTVMHV